MSRAASGLGAAIALAALAACSPPARPPFERSPPNGAIAAALQRVLANDRGCRPFVIGPITAWQYPLENHTNVTNYALQVDADVSVVRRAPPAAGDVGACFGAGADAPADWRAGQARTLAVRAWLDCAGDGWTLRSEGGGTASLPLSPPHAFRLGVNERPGR